MKIDWTTVFAAIGAITGVLTGGDKIVTWFRDRRMRIRDDAALWSMTTQMLVGEQRRWTTTLVYDTALGPALHLREMRIASPRGARFCDFSQKPGRGQFDVGQRRFTKIMHNMDLRERIIGGNEATEVVELPPKPWWQRERVRIRIAVVGEERTARRKVRRVIVASREVEWSK